MSWWNVLNKISDDDINKFIGTDYALVMKYLKMNGILFLVSTVINCIVLIPTYATGHPLNNQSVDSDF